MPDLPALYTPDDNTTGHGPWPPVGYQPPPEGASANVFINSKNVHRVGDKTLPHFSTPPDIHSDTISTGSPTVFVNGKPMAIIGKSVLTCQYGEAGIVASFGATSVTVDNGG